MTEDLNEIYSQLEFILSLKISKGVNLHGFHGKNWRFTTSTNGQIVVEKSIGRGDNWLEYVTSCSSIAELRSILESEAIKSVADEPGPLLKNFMRTDE